MAAQNFDYVIDVDDPKNTDRLFPKDKGRGHDPSQVVRAMYSPPSDLQLIPRSEWSARIKEQEALKARASDARTWDCLDQGQVGYCWAHSTTQAVMMVRTLMGLPHVPLSAYAVAATIKKGADEGGWCGLSAKFARERGIPAQSLWPQGDRNYRNYDKPEVWANAKLHTIAEDWADLTKAEYDQNLTFDQIASWLLTGMGVCAVDFNWWSHSVLALDVVEVEAGSFGLRILNSWGPSWEDHGSSVLRGRKAIPDGAYGVRVIIPSPN